MNVAVTSLLATSVVSAGAGIAVAEHARHSSEQFADLGGFATNLVGGGAGVGIAALAGLAALHSPWRSAATAVAAIGGGIAIGGAAGLGDLYLSDALGRSDANR